ncbi:MAG: hypothetical protein IIB07_01485 [Bacteroidetes bacterium]|nr:hypothetical protein [Bacteroidota bacterium]MCH8942677.1 hypothetical protein [Bacteroidota bacterium]
MAYIIFYISLLVWLLPPLRQYKGKLFLYFLVFAIADPLTRISTISFHTNAYQIHGLISFAAILAVSVNKISKKNIVFIFTGFILTLFVISTQDRNIIFLYLILLHLVIIWYFLKETLISFSKNNFLTLGWVVLILYEISIVLKLIVALEVTQASTIYYYLTTGFQILIAVFFTIYKVEHSPKIKLSVKNMDMS